jgi:hypothetical protein
LAAAGSSSAIILAEETNPEELRTTQEAPHFITHRCLRIGWRSRTTLEFVVVFLRPTSRNLRPSPTAITAPNAFANE